MASLSEILDDAHGGEVISALGCKFGSRPNKRKPRWPRFCRPFPWGSSNRQRHPTVWATCSG